MSYVINKRAPRRGRGWVSTQRGRSCSSRRWLPLAHSGPGRHVRGRRQFLRETRPSAVSANRRRARPKSYAPVFPNSPGLSHRSAIHTFRESRERRIDFPVNWGKPRGEQGRDVGSRKRKFKVASIRPWRGPAVARLHTFLAWALRRLVMSIVQGRRPWHGSGTSTRRGDGEGVRQGRPG